MKITQKLIDSAKHIVECWAMYGTEAVEVAQELLRLADFQGGNIGSGPNGELTPADIERLYAADYWQCLKPVSEADIAGVQSFSQAFPEAMDRPLRDVFTWRARTIALEKHGLPKWRPQYQQRGTCVGQGGKLAADDLMALNFVLNGVPFPGRAAVAGMYPGSRVDVGGQPGRWDGSTGSWLNKWVTQRGGVLLLKTLGLSEDSRNEDEQLAVRWCASRDGVPAEFEDDAKERVVAVGTLCRTTEELTAGLNAGGVLVQCSNLIASGRRDSNGYSRVSRSGGHCQLVDGCRDVSGKIARGFLQQNSWSEQWGSGPVWPEDQPAGSVWLDADDMQAQLNQRDSYLWFGVNGPASPDDQISL